MANISFDERSIEKGVKKAFSDWCEEKDRADKRKDIYHEDSPITKGIKLGVESAIREFWRKTKPKLLRIYLRNQKFS